VSPRSRKNTAAAKSSEPIPRPAFGEAAQRRQPGDAHTRQTFCAANHISESFYFQLKRQGKGPREIQLNNRRVIITPEAERDWRREREAETMAKRARG
jgi:hypothetical protein